MASGSIPNGIRAEHVLAAILDFNLGIAHDFADSTKYDLVIDEKRYPPKAIIGLAAKHAVGRLLLPRDFTGGEESRCFQILRDLGFMIRPKPGITADRPNEHKLSVEDITISTYIEITSLEHAHGGEGWSLGECLWIPTRDRRGFDRYAIMRDLREGDGVYHFVSNKWPEGSAETRYYGYSVIASEVREVSEEPPIPGSWGGMAPYYRVDLRDFSKLSNPVSLIDCAPCAPWRRGCHDITEG